MEATIATRFFTPPTEALRYLPEGPIVLDTAAWPWEGAWVAWVGIQHGSDSQEGSVNLLSLSTLENRSYTLPGRPGFVAETNRPGVLLAGMEHELVLLDLAQAEPQLTPTGLRVIPHERTIINDGLATPFGLVFGTKDLRFEDPIAHLYFYRHGRGALDVLQDGQTCSNGKALRRRAEGWTLFDIDTPTRRVMDYTLEADRGRITRAQVLADFSDKPAYPDGMRLAPGGRHLVVAFYDPDDVPEGTARLISLETGATERVWRTPGSPRVTCPAFVEHEGRVRLLLTTAVEGMPDEQRAKHPHAGTFFLADTPFAGPLPPNPKVEVDAWEEPPLGKSQPLTVSISHVE